MTRAKRVVQLTGGSSYAVTLPKAWAKAHGIKEGSMIELTINDDGSITVTPEGREVIKASERIVIKDSLSMARDIVGAYLLGFNVIRIESSIPFDKLTLNVLKQRIRGLAGAEIVEETPKSIELQVIFDPESIAPSKILIRMWSILLRMITDLIDAIVKTSNENLPSVANQDEEVDRYYFMIVRSVRAGLRDLMLAKRMDLSPLRLLDIRLVSKFLEDAGDQISSLASDLNKSTLIKLNQDMVERLNKLKDLCLDLGKKAIDAFLTEDPKLTLSALSIKEKFVKEGALFMEMPSKKDVAIHTYMLKIYSRLERVVEDFADIAEHGAPISTENVIKEASEKVSK